jgi:hypothetical protein
MPEMADNEVPLVTIMSAEAIYVSAVYRGGMDPSNASGAQIKIFAI